MNYLMCVRWEYLCVWLSRNIALFAFVSDIWFTSSVAPLVTTVRTAILRFIKYGLTKGILLMNESVNIDQFNDNSDSFLIECMRFNSKNKFTVITYDRIWIVSFGTHWTGLNSRLNCGCYHPLLLATWTKIVWFNTTHLSNDQWTNELLSTFMLLEIHSFHSESKTITIET